MFLVFKKFLISCSVSYCYRKIHINNDNNYNYEATPPRTREVTYYQGSHASLKVLELFSRK